MDIVSEGRGPAAVMTTEGLSSLSLGGVESSSVDLGSLAGESMYGSEGEWRERNQRRTPRWTPRSPRGKMSIANGLLGYCSYVPTGRMSGRLREKIANISTGLRIRC